MTKKARIIYTAVALTCTAVAAGFITGVHAEQKPSHHGEKVTVSFDTRWLSGNPDDLEFIIEYQGIPEERYVVDQEAREEISHYETVHHSEVSHQENVYSTRTKYTFTLLDINGDEYTEIYYDLTDEERRAVYRSAKVKSVDTQEERYVSGTRTVIDREAYDERVKVIDQSAQEERGHYETVYIGQKGYYVNKTETVPYSGEGHFEGWMRKSSEERNEE